MAQQTYTTFTDLLKRNYKKEYIRDAIVRDNSCVSWIFKKVEDATGERFQHPVLVRRASGSTSYVQEGGAHPTSANATRMIVYDNLKQIETSKQITQYLLDLTRSGNNTYLKSLNDTVIEAKDEMTDAMERQLFAEAGYAAICASADSGTSKIITLAADTNMDQFYIGQKVEVLQTSTGTHNSVGSSAATTITAISESTPSITLAAAVGNYSSVNEDYGVAVDGNFESGTGIYAFSLNDLCGTTTGVHGVNTTTYPEYVGHVVTYGTNLLKDIQKVVDKIEGRSKGNVDMIFAHDSLLRDVQYSICDPRYLTQPGDGRMGTGALTFKGRSNKQITIKSSVYANPIDRMFVVDSSSIKTYATSLFEWESDDTGNLLHKVSGYSYYEAVLHAYYQICAFARFHNGYVDAISL